MRRIAPVALFLSLVVAACAGGSGAGTVPRSSADVITAEELRSVATYSAYDAIARLRPQWLRSRVPGQEPVVFIDGSQLGGLGTLRTVQASILREIRYRNGRDATTRYGTGFGGGTIEMRSQG